MLRHWPAEQEEPVPAAGREDQEGRDASREEAGQGGWKRHRAVVCHDQRTYPWTQEFFEKNNYFGLKKENVVVFEQGVLPCISNEGKILLESKSKVAVAPDGNGGLYQALIQSGVVADMGKRGIQHIHAYCVDNCLVKVCDPVFIGFSASKNVDIATKVVRKRNAKESVGLILQKNGKPDVVEYSEISSEDAEAKDSKDHNLLKFRAANIVNHYYSYKFLESIPEWAKKLPHHVARKKIPFVNTETGETVKPEKANGIKLEQFVFDCFPFLTLEKFACMEVKREDEFSPLKNARGTGEDDPDTSKQDIMTQGKKWVQAAGATVVSEDQKDGIEVSPLISYVSLPRPTRLQSVANGNIGRRRPRFSQVSDGQGSCCH
jgi:UDP-N-acetylglucosamine/UDP-N-acetylgalactosamine diphosphorylase